MSYDNAKKTTYSWNGVTFGSGSSTRVLQGPKGKTGRIVECQVSVTTSFVGTSTAAAVQVGITGTAARDLNLPIGAAGAGTAAQNAVQASNTAASIVDQATPGAFAYLPADTPFLVSFIAPTGGSPAGVADVFLDIEWFF